MAGYTQDPSNLQARSHVPEFSPVLGGPPDFAVVVCIIGLEGGPKITITNYSHCYLEGVHTSYVLYCASTCVANVG